LSASNLFNRLSITNIRWKKIIQGGWQQKLLTNIFKPFGGGAITVWRILDNPVGKGKAETPEPRQRQLRDEAKSCGNQPAHIRVINRRQSDLASSKKLKGRPKKAAKKCGKEDCFLLTTVNHIRVAAKPLPWGNDKPTH
jgi:hypothetical protein